MGKSLRLRMSDVIQVMRLVGECRDLRHDARRWMQHAAQGLSQLIGAKVVFAGIDPPAGLDRHGDAVVIVEHGIETDAQCRAFQAYMQSELQLKDPAFHRFLALRRPRSVFRRDELISNREFRRSGQYDYRRLVFQIEEYVFSQAPTSNGCWTHGFAVHRSVGDRSFTERDSRLVNLLNFELSRLIGTVLDDGRGGCFRDLSPRQREVLQALLDGCSEKHVAERLKISRHTAHAYVVAVYRKFGVSSRAELLAVVLHGKESRGAT